ncbi:MAG TPA: Ig-like domain-containing protein, partial [Verrucomicrobiae bacterium]|nr:Ig-like domain-containing protein [Verrucomicrobiae bacterium]
MDRTFHLRSFAAPCAAVLLFFETGASVAATLTGSFAPVDQGADVNLTAEGPLDWVHWGLVTETTVNRKASVTPVIGNFRVVDAPTGSAYVFRYADNYNGYSWRDGTPLASVTNTPTGVWAYDTPALGSGFEFSVPADTSVRTLKVYVGTFAARGEFTARLSGSSAPGYTNSSLFNDRNGPGGVYSIDFAADSAGQQLTVRWVLTETARPPDPAPNVTLQAAALAAAGANNPPFAAITTPSNNAAHPAGQTLTINADAFDADDSVAKVEFFAGETKLGEDISEPYSFDWAAVPAGRHVLYARATDSASGSRSSAPVELFAHTTGGTLAASVAIPSTSVDLTSEGNLDWAHWGLLSPQSFNHKATVAPLISNFTKIGANEPIRFQETFTAYSWSDGTPVAATNETHTGVYVRGLTNGFTFSVPADATQRTLKVHVSLYGVHGLFQAYLTDFSAPAYADTSLDSIFGNDYGVITLNYAAATNGQNLVVRYTTQRAYDELYGNVALQAATLSGAAIPTNLAPTISISNPANNESFAAPANITLTADASDGDGTVVRAEFFSGATKLGEVGSAPFSLTWSNVTAGSYTLT